MIQEILNGDTKALARKTGYAPIKKEYLIVQEELTEESHHEKGIENLTLQETPDEKAPDSRKKRPHNKKFRGMDRQREKKMASARAEIRKNSVRICPSVVIPGRECRYGEKCTAEHSVEKYMSMKPADIGNECRNFDQMGSCPYSVSCRFAGAHTNPDFSQMKKDPSPEFQQTLNWQSVGLQIALRKHEYDFKASGEAVKNAIESTGAMHRESLKLDMRSLAGKPYLAPLTTVGNLPFRRLCVSLGAEITCSEMAMATSLLSGQPSEWALIKRHLSEKIFGFQLAGGYPDTMTKAAQIVSENMEVDFLDINLGCPLDVVNDKGGGCALFNRQTKLVQVCQHTAHNVIKKLVDECPPQLLTLHPRSKEQRYTKSAEWDYVPTAAEATQGLTPLWVCGDVLSHEDYYSRLANNSISGIMIGRGALIKPWIFTEIQEKRHWDITASERLDIVKKFVDFGLEHWGSDDPGVETTRRFLLELLSFSYRYIPAGLLEVLPQKINQKPPLFRGRNEMEDLLSSPASSDWVKITEMFLGPAPDGFLFLPKHNANAY